MPRMKAAAPITLSTALIMSLLFTDFWLQVQSELMNTYAHGEASIALFYSKDHPELGLVLFRVVLSSEKI